MREAGVAMPVEPSRRSWLPWSWRVRLGVGGDGGAAFEYVQAGAVPDSADAIACGAVEVVEAGVETRAGELLAGEGRAVGRVQGEHVHDFGVGGGDDDARCCGVAHDYQ